MCYFRVKVNSKNVYRGQKTTSEISEIPEAEVDGATRDAEPVTDQTRPRRRRRAAPFIQRAMRLAVTMTVK